jgi:hypothetical protein
MVPGANSDILIVEQNPYIERVMPFEQERDDRHAIGGGTNELNLGEIGF